MNKVEIVESTLPSLFCLWTFWLRNTKRRNLSRMINLLHFLWIKIAALSLSASEYLFGSSSCCCCCCVPIRPSTFVDSSYFGPCSEDVGGMSRVVAERSVWYSFSPGFISTSLSMTGEVGLYYKERCLFDKRSVLEEPVFFFFFFFA